MKEPLTIVACCVVCGDLLPEDRYLTCSHDCYVQYKVDKEIDKRRREGKGRQKPYVCENCKKEFHTQYKRLRHVKLMHMHQPIPKYCSMPCKDQAIKEHRERAQRILGL